MSDKDVQSGPSASLEDRCKVLIHSWYERNRLDESDAQWMREKTYEQCADELTTVLLAAPPAGARDAVTDGMVERAEVAVAEYWKDPGLFVKCGDCKGTGKVPCGDSQDWCDCGGGMVNTGNDRDALRAALEAALAAQPAPRVGGDARLEELAYVPGAWRCPKCSLRLIARTLHMQDGGMSANNQPQACANGCGPMWRVTEREDRQDARRFANEQSDKLNALLSTRPAESVAQGGAVDPGLMDRLNDIHMRVFGKPYDGPNTPTPATGSGGEAEIPDELQLAWDAIDDVTYGPLNKYAKDVIARYLTPGMKGHSRIVGSRTIDGVHVIVAKPASDLLPEQLLVRYDDYLAAATSIVVNDATVERGCVAMSVAAEFEDHWPDGFTEEQQADLRSSVRAAQEAVFATHPAPAGGDAGEPEIHGYTVEDQEDWFSSPADAAESLREYSDAEVGSEFYLTPWHRLPKQTLRITGTEYDDYEVITAKPGAEG